MQNNAVDIYINNIELNEDDKKRTLFQNIKFRVKPKTVYAIVGQNGIGKTTLLNSLLNLLDKNIYSIKGEIFINGVDTYKCDEIILNNIRSKVVKYIFQDSVTCFDPQKKLKYYFEKFDLINTDLEELLDYFLLPTKEKILNYYPFELSGGIAQRLAIIWGIISRPGLLLLDEPNSALDIPITNLLSNKLKEIINRNDISILMVTQDINFALNTADKIGLLNNYGITEFNTTVDDPDHTKSLLLNSIMS